MTTRAILVALYVSMALSCTSSEKPRAVAPKQLPAHELGTLDYTLPASASRQTLAERFESTPAPYESVECTNTYRSGAEPPFPAVPSLWLRNNGDMTLLASPTTGVEWAQTTWSATFEADGSKLECVDLKVSKPTTGEAWSAFVYTRTLLDGVEWLRPAGRHVFDLSGVEYTEVETLRAPWTREKALRLIELHPDFRFFDERRWPSAIKWAESEGDTDLLYELKRHYQPTGQCGNDSYPAQYTDELQLLCLRTGRLACVAELAGLTDGPEFPHPRHTWFRDLPDGTDAYTYAAGLILHYPGSRGDEIVRPERDPYGPSAYPWEESNSLFRERLITIGADANTDPLNRHRIALAVVNVGGHFLSRVEKVAHEREVATWSWVPPATSAFMLERANAQERQIEKNLAEGRNALVF